MDNFTRDPRVNVEPGDVVVREQRQIAVWANADGDIVVHQENYPNDDAIVIVQRQWLDALIESLKAARDRVEGNDG